MRRLGHNLRALLLLVADLVPTAVARSEHYRSLRRRLSRAPERFAVKSAARPFTPGHWRERSLAGPETDLVIDGFPGSANSWVANAIRRATDRPVRIESHFHYSAQLKRARSFGVPAIVLIRAPQAACDSLKSKQPQTWDLLIILRWLTYYRYVARHPGSWHVVCFEQVIADLDRLRRTNPDLERLCARPLDGEGESKRTSTQRTPIERSRPWMRWLLRRAERRYRQLTGGLWQDRVAR